MVTNRKKQSSFRLTKDAEESHLSNLNGHPSKHQLLRAFSTLASVPSIYIQQFWDTMTYEENTRIYSCQLDEQWFTLSADLLCKALNITPIDPAHLFVSPPTGETVMDFVNQLGYPEPIQFVSNMRVNHLYQPWRVIMSLINQCLTRKKSGSDKPRHPVLQMLWGIVTRTNVDHTELLRFTKLIIYYLVSNHNIHRRPESAVHLTRDDYLVGNLKFVPKGEKDEVFGIPIPKELITEAIQQLSYYQDYLVMVARNTKAREGGKKKTATKVQKTKKPAAVKQTKPAPVKQSKPAPANQPKSLKKKPSKRIPSRKVRKGKTRLKLVDEEEESQDEPEPQGKGEDSDIKRAKRISLGTFQPQGEGKGEEYDLKRALKMSLDSLQAPVRGVAISESVAEAIQKLPVVKGKGKAIITEEQAAHSMLDLHKLKKKSTTDQFIIQRRVSTEEDATTGPSSQPLDESSEKVVHDTSSPTDSISWIRTWKSHGSLAGPNPEPMHEDFYQTVYPNVHDNLKLRTDEHVTLETPPSTTEPLSSMKNLDDTDTFGDFSSDAELVARVFALEKRSANLEHVFTTQLKTSNNLASRIFTLEHHDLEQGIDNYVRETVNENVQIAFREPMLQRFRDLTEEEMKQMLYNWMFKSASYLSHPDHLALYEALEKSMDHDRQNTIHETLSKSRKRRRDDQDPPSPPKDDDQDHP
ncbi:hypothetical protein Tco_1248047 [Tanacetum coccineum]